MVVFFLASVAHVARTNKHTKESRACLRKGFRHWKNDGRLQILVGNAHSQRRACTATFHTTLHHTMNISGRDMDDVLRDVSEFCRLRVDFAKQLGDAIAQARPLTGTTDPKTAALVAFTVSLLSQLQSVFRDFERQLNDNIADVRVTTGTTGSLSAPSIEHGTSSIDSSWGEIQSTIREFEELAHPETIVRITMGPLETLHLRMLQNETPGALDEPLEEATLDDCAICLERRHGLTVRLPCDHTFHCACALHWVHSMQTCPLCRRCVDSLRECEFPEISSMP
jgi:Ring finger domain